MNATITRATVDHALRIKLRQCDLEEAEAWCPGVAPNLLVAASVKTSECWTALDGDEVVAIGGHSIHEDRAVPWLMASDLLDKHRKQLLRVSRAFLDDLKQRHPGMLLANHVARGNTKARLYLRALGFRIVPTPGPDAKFDFFYQ